MNRINRKSTTDQVFSFATERLSRDVSSMEAKRSSAIDVFNATAKGLEAINKDLTASAARCRALAATAIAKAEEAEKMIADNSNVCQKIYEIIGKPVVSEIAA